MTKGEIVGAAYVQLTSGYPNTDSSTWWEDVDLLFSPAVNFVMTGDYFMAKRDEGEEKIIQPLFVQTFKGIAVTDDADRGKKTSTLPKPPLAFPKNRAVPYVGTVLGKQFIPIEQSGGAMQEYFAGFKTEECSYELEGLIIIYHNLPAGVTSVMIKELVSAKSILDTEEVLLPDGGELKVMELMVDFFTGKRQLPKDYYNTNKETPTA